MKNKFDNDEMHARALMNIYKSYSGTQEQRENSGEAKRFATIRGAQWEGSFNDGYAMSDLGGFPRIECSDLRKNISKVESEYRRNRMTVRFKPAGNMASKGIAEKLNDSFRADWKESDGKEAMDATFKNCLLSGYGAIRLNVVDEDEYDPLNEDKKIEFEPVYDPDSSVLFDLNAKDYYKRDAKWCAEIFCLTPEEAEEEYGTRDFGSMNMDESDVMFDWSTPDVVYVANYYFVQLEETEIQAFTNPFTGQSVIYDLDDLNIDDDEYENDNLEIEGTDDEPEDSPVETDTGFTTKQDEKIVPADGDISVYRELINSGFEPIGKPKKIKKRVVYAGVMAGGEWLVEPYKIAGEHLPIVPMYGERCFIDNQERVSGMIEPLMDITRMRNTTVSMAMDNALRAMGDNIKIINVDGLDDSLAEEWNNYVNDRPAYLSVNSILDKNDNPLSMSPVVGDTGVTQMSPALVQLIQFAGMQGDKIGGFADMDKIPSNIATDTVDAIFNRLDNTSFIYMDNAAKTLRRIGEVWLSMKREITGSMKYVRMLDEEGNETYDVFQGEIKDEATGKMVPLNDLSVGKYEVDVDVSESTDARRKEAAKNIFELLTKIPPTSPRFQQVLDFYVMNMDGYKLDELQALVRKDMIMSGAIKPETEAEEKELMQAKQAQASQPNPAAMMAQAEMQKSQAEMLSAQTRGFEAQTKAFAAQNKAEKEQAEIMQILNNIDESKKNQIIEQIRLMKDISQDAFNDVNKLQ